MGNFTLEPAIYKAVFFIILSSAFFGCSVVRRAGGNTPTECGIYTFADTTSVVTVFGGVGPYS
jgi:hypothetical protein